ncbi:MAG: HD domain-containing protein [Planctomycetia bacterium]
MTLGPRFEQALAYAALMHNGQVRKNTGIPYVAHVLAVAALVMEHGGDEDETIGALLHDVVEDCGGAGRRADVACRFGERVAELVDGCTDTDQTPKPPWRQRKELYVAHLPTAGEPIRLISACDKLHNARSILADWRILNDNVWKRFAGGKDGTLWYYRALVEAYRQAPLGRTARVVDELERVVREIHRLVGDDAKSTPSIVPFPGLQRNDD